VAILLFTQRAREAVWKVVLRGCFATLARMRRPYPTDLSDDEWNHIESHMPAPKGYGRPRGVAQEGETRILEESASRLVQRFGVSPI
jgi:hypothetical protein